MYWNRYIATGNYPSGFCWIVTLDVLKYANMESLKAANALNSNIRCIEIGKCYKIYYLLLGWIVTLDVLKWICLKQQNSWLMGWIVTLDVLK